MLLQGHRSLIVLTVQKLNSGLAERCDLTDGVEKCYFSQWGWNGCWCCLSPARLPCPNQKTLEQPDNKCGVSGGLLILCLNNRWAYAPEKKTKTKKPPKNQQTHTWNILWCHKGLHSLIYLLMRPFRINLNDQCVAPHCVIHLCCSHWRWTHRGEKEQHTFGDWRWTPLCWGLHFIFK